MNLSPAHKVICLLFVIIVAIIAYKFYKARLVSKKEDYSYHFGFPTWGNVYNSSLVEVNPFLYGNYAVPPMYYNYGTGLWIPYNSGLNPYLSNRCYSADKHEQCVPGYVKNVRHRRGKRDEARDARKYREKTYQCCRAYM